MSKLNLNNEQVHFSAVNYPEVLNEIKEIMSQVKAVSGNFKREILISFLRYHSLKIEWLVGNDLLVKMITAGSMKIYHTERLFEANHDNTAFLADLEEYIETELASCQFDPKHRNVLACSWSQGGSLEDQRFHACGNLI